MCGITGFLASSDTTIDWQSAVEAMSTAITRRGPDASGHWLDREAGVALGHRRLSILDLSPTGAQPMTSSSGRFTIVFNGEIYNFPALRSSLEARGRLFRGTSDTEVVLEAFETWGPRETLEKLVGMFAFAAWDRERGELLLARDRLGEKPLYYGWMGGTFLFGSELKALRAHPAFRAEINRDALTLLLRHNCIPAPYTIYRGVAKLPPATLMTVRPGRPGEGTPAPYWSAREMAERGVREPFSGSESDALAALEELLLDSVRGQMLADVPLGAFLSGGLDSSLIVALMQRASARPVKTFTIGFDEAAYNEADQARAVAAHLGTEHTQLVVRPEEALAVIPGLPGMYDEPFADSSQIPTHLVAKLARQHVTVSLSGDGGDELFAGYNRHAWGARLWNGMDRVPAGMREVTARALTAVSPGQWDRAFGAVAPALPKQLRLRIPGDKIHKLAGLLGARSSEALYRKLTSHWDHPARVVLNAHEPPTLLDDAARIADLPDLTRRMMYLDLVTYLPDDILVKVDRAAMATSLETRAPFLDHRVVEFAWKLPLALKLRDGETKWALRQILYRHVPQALVDRPKMGFGLPIDTWLRGPLREWAEGLLDESRLRREGFFDPAPIRALWGQHVAGTANCQHHLWTVLAFQAWLEAAH